MAYNAHSTTASFWICVLVAFLGTKSHVCANGKHVFDISNFKPQPKGTVKTIEVPEDGDMIDCVDIYKQPALDHPLIKDIKVDPELMKDDENPKIYQTWHKYGECPKGTIPIRRTRHNEVQQNHHHVKKYPAEFQEYAKVRQDGVFQGASANIDIWNPHVEADEFSTAQIWIQSDTTESETLTVIEAGLIVYPKKFHDSKTRLFVYWTRDNYRSSGCLNLDCPGFVQTSHKFALGVTFKHISIYNGTVWELKFSIHKEPKFGNWKLRFEDVELGYWPAEHVVTCLVDGAERVEWGGEILNNKPPYHHTTTEMGNGYFSYQGNTRAAGMRFLQVHNKDYNIENATNLQKKTSHPNCYDVTIGEGRTNYKTHFYYGGPGNNRNCP